MFTAKWWCAAAVAGMCTGVATAVLAAETITTRSPDAAYADLMRDWNAKPGNQAGAPVRMRNLQNANADLIRDFGAKGSGEQGAAFTQRSLDAMYKDLVRDWSPDKPADGRQAAYTNQ
ncbi:MAG TPA: hypothetical protein VNM24_06470 [Burkholderiales bacterium]|jgi:hypothetical protein|nr:hypothetical protein [Burkholderiales bacterium]